MLRSMPSVQDLRDLKKKHFTRSASAERPSRANISPVSSAASCCATDVDSYLRRVLISTSTFDPATKLPLVALDSTAMPPSSAPVFAPLVAAVIDALPKREFVLVFFACGSATAKPSWSWLASTYKQLPKQTKKWTKKVIVVHESWWVRAASDMLRGVVSAKFKSKMVHVSSLSQLAQLVDVTCINISREVYLHDLRFDAQVTVPKHTEVVFGQPLGAAGLALVARLVRFLSARAPATPHVFKRTEHRAELRILRDACDRAQLFSLESYPPAVAAALLKLYLAELPEPLVRVDSIPLPLMNETSYASAVLGRLSAQSLALVQLVLPLLYAVSQSPAAQQDAAKLAACVGPSFIGLRNPDKDKIIVGIRFIRMLIEDWPEIGRSLRGDAPRPPPARSARVRAEPAEAPLSPESIPGSPETSVPPRDLINLFSKVNDMTASPAHSRSPSLEAPIVFEQHPQPPSPRKMPPPPLPRKVLRESSSAHNVPPSVPPRKFGPQCKVVASTGRGSMVAELAKLYEEKVEAAKVLSAL